ncbi:MAG: RadC family protein [Oscillospiraceae bacterium]|nr:RadC family protein [Oscillospiraceae bacterium]
MSTAQKGNVHDGHRQRMRERFLAEGFNGFSQHQIIEMLLFYTCPRIDTNEIAHELINKFGSISGVFDADVEDLTAVKGVNFNAAVLFKMITKCQSVYYRYHSESMVYDNIEKLKNLFKSCYVGETHEKFMAACFDNSLRIIDNRVLSYGSPSSAPVDMRKLAELAVRTKCAYMAVSHNHPSGSAAPSMEDVAVTRRIVEFMGNMNVKVLDHIIVGSNSAVSMRDGAHINIFE